MSKQILLSSTPVAAPEKGPFMETTVAETLSIRKFAELAQFDLADQVQKASLDPHINKKQFLLIKHSAETIVAWLAGVVMTCDGMLQAAKLKEPEDA